MDLLAKTIITPPKIILNSEYLSRNLKRINKCCFQTFVNKHLYRPKKLEYKMAQWFLYSLHKYHNGDWFLQTVVILAKLLI